MGEGGVPEAARGAGLDLPRCHGLRALKLIPSLRNTKRNPFAQKEGGGVNFIEGGELREAFAVDGEHDPLFPGGTIQTRPPLGVRGLALEEP